MRGLKDERQERLDSTEDEGEKVQLLLLCLQMIVGGWKYGLHVCLLCWLCLLHRFLYLFNRHDKIKFPLSDEEKRRLDVLGIAGLVAESRAAGKSQQHPAVDEQPER